MRVGIDVAWLAAVFLVAIRLGPLFILTPVLGSVGVPVRVRILLGVALAATLVASLNTSEMGRFSTLGAFLTAAIVELVLGMALAFGLLAAFGAFLFGGRLLDLQIGFGLASLVDPLTRSQSPLLGTALNLLAVVLFFAVDGHHLIVRGLAYSLEKLPPGQSLSQLNPSAVLAQFGIVFSYGLAIVAPAVFALLLIDVAMALLGRTMPQMNIFMLSMPVKVVVGLLVLALSTKYMLPIMRKAFEGIPAYWQDVLSLRWQVLAYG